jgi:superfamily I DNA and/or RNA helicase
VAATSHKAINNLLNEVEIAAVADNVSFHGLKKGGGDDAFDGRCITSTDSNEDCETSAASLIAGTSWLFSRAGMDQRLDYLFLDEAGQVALADAVAMGACARNLVLLGDPQQLSHVRQGVHPQLSGCSVLEHLLHGASTVAEERGVFLARTWRMHPEITSFVSDLAYDGRLVSAYDRDRQRIESRGLTGSGIRFIGVTHSDNAQQSPEEAGKIASE